MNWRNRPYGNYLTGQAPAPDLFEGPTWGTYEAGKRVAASDYLLAKAALQHAGRTAARFHDNYDLWLTSTLGAPRWSSAVSTANVAKIRSEKSPF